MPAATSKADLMRVTGKAWGKLDALLDRVPAQIWNTAGAEGTTITDILTHRAHWIGLFFQWVDEGRAGGPVSMPDHGVKWNELKSYNAGLKGRYTDLTPGAARDRLAQAHQRLVDFVEAETDNALYGMAMPGGTGWTMGRYAEAAGASHYRSAAKYIRACLRDAQS